MSRSTVDSCSSVSVLNSDTCFSAISSFMPSPSPFLAASAAAWIHLSEWCASASSSAPDSACVDITSNASGSRSCAGRQPRRLHPVGKKPLEVCPHSLEEVRPAAADECLDGGSRRVLARLQERKCHRERLRSLGGHRLGR